MARRSWKIAGDAPYALQIAADGSSALVDYADDQAWEISLGTADSPALAASTRLGGRAGLISIQPMWWLGGRVVYLPGEYASPPVITAFAPGYLAVETRLTQALTLAAAWYALDSHSLALRFVMKNSGAPQAVTLDLVGFAGASGAERKLIPLASASGGDPVLWFGTFTDADPVLLLEGGKAGEGGRRLTRTLTLEEGGTAEWRALVVSLNGRGQSRDQAQRLLATNWVKPPTVPGQGKAVIPLIETGDADLDTLLAFSYQQVMSAFVQPRANPAPGLIPRRQPDAGYRPYIRQTYGADQRRPVGGDEVTPPDTYLLTLAAAGVRPEWAQAVLRGYLATQQPDGWIDWSPGLNGERRGWLCLPILARLAWSIFQYSEDADFLAASLPGLARFFERWFAPDLDRDNDGLPEWMNEGQTAYPFLPIFSRGLTVGQNADLRRIESPDLIAYLLSEAISLREIARTVGQPMPRRLEERIIRLKEALAALWQPAAGRFGYRDRDTHTSGQGRELILDRPANETIAGLTFEPAQRLIVEIVGGRTRANTLVLHIDGIAHDGSAVHETASADDFSWTAGRGTYTTMRAWRQIDTLRVEGVIALYRINVRTVDTSYLDISALMPLWAVEIDPEHARATHALLKDPAHFWRAHGVVMFSAQDAAYRPEKVEFSAGVWMFWQTLMGEALIEMGDTASAADLLANVLAGMLPVVKAEKAFYAGYHAERPGAIGVRGHAGGAVPLHLFLRVIGVRIVSGERVWTGGAYHWTHPVTVTHHGVRVRRAADGTTVTFPGGEMVHLPPDVPWGCVTPDGWSEEG